MDRTFAAASVKLVHARHDKTSSSAHAHAHAEAMIFVPLSGALAFDITGTSLIANAHRGLVVRANRSVLGGLGPVLHLRLERRADR